ncbi:MAG: hypothetical protein J5979_05960 [Lachnospiraceae bacterium]|nr:hypothetical protein [Lachnospiraceae bacterium]
MGKRIAALIMIVTMVVGLCGCHEESGRGDGSLVVETTDPLKRNLPDNITDQLKIIARKYKKWTKGESEDDPYLSYAVTDLDQNGRLEIIASSADQGSGRFTNSEYFQVNRAGDGLEKISTPYKEGWSQDDIVSNMETAYYDEDSGGYYYITGDFVTAGLATGYYDSVSALTLQQGKITTECLGYVQKENEKDSKSHTTYCKITKKGREKKVSKREYNEDDIADEWFSSCGKLSVNISWFQLKKAPSKLSVVEIEKILEQSYEEFQLGYPVKQKKKKISGYSIKVPVITRMEDKGKQKRINHMIVQKIKKQFQPFGKEGKKSFALWYHNFHVTYAARDRLSIVGEYQGYGKDAAHPCAVAYAVNLDLEQEKEISQKKLLPEKYRKDVEKLIINGNCKDVSEMASAYRKAVKMANGKKKKQIFGLQDLWDCVDVYQGKYDYIGVIIPTPYVIGSYAIYEIHSSDLEEY